MTTAQKSQYLKTARTCLRSKQQDVQVASVSPWTCLVINVKLCINIKNMYILCNVLWKNLYIYINVLICINIKLLYLRGFCFHCHYLISRYLTYRVQRVAFLTVARHKLYVSLQQSFGHL
jgi:hypothetical protein